MLLTRSLLQMHLFLTVEAKDAFCSLGPCSCFQFFARSSPTQNQLTFSLTAAQTQNMRIKMTPGSFFSKALELGTTQHKVLNSRVFCCEGS